MVDLMYEIPSQPNIKARTVSRISNIDRAQARRPYRRHELPRRGGRQCAISRTWIENRFRDGLSAG